MKAPGQAWGIPSGRSHIHTGLFFASFASFADNKLLTPDPTHA